MKRQRMENLVPALPFGRYGQGYDALCEGQGWLEIYHHRVNSLGAHRAPTSLT